MLSGQKRWASARRGGMTVLGKVAVPKPINLPSQRLKDHSLDPNVEIVPKCNHGWGSRSSSSSSNSRCSALLSPNIDGGTRSTGHLSGCPSSGDTGARSSTAGSETITNARGPNSRSSSPSGANQTSHPALRPRSAETRPGSSQLSQFAEPLSDNSVERGRTGTTDKLVLSNSLNDHTIRSEFSTSSMLTAQNRCVSARRGGMTVLGKVAKPINLPSQRLEDQGLDPNVEIVPKGTHICDSRSSSSPSNAWSSASLSPNTDGGTGSASHLSCRPSSGGTGTRPSTAGSERAYGPIVNACGPNLSSSGALTSNQTSHPALPPCSAETRPCSSQLSRFAERLSDNSVACGGIGKTEKLVLSNSLNDLIKSEFSTSSMLTAQKRWASARRGGMPVLGKVAVPKPINLPSQRLEDQSLEPNVETVPKGTHICGSRSSSSASNAWGSASLSPNTNGGTGSASYFSGRPSSGGTGTRPSTAGSERAYDLITNACGPSSIPSSSSGALTSIQTSQLALHPCSAETRPGSSQLYRLAEPLSDNSVECGGIGTTEKLVLSNSLNDLAIKSQFSTSSMLTGQKGWASARRGGMTLLGKVAVPKPINLPSQRSENHGLDPNVEIVPKGTHSFGYRSSSSSSNAWGSASLSPITDGGTGSPSHLSGRPSSGDTGTRPSTAGSERAYDPVTNTWGPNSRPSFSSGALTSNQTSDPALRPRSAETRPGSSQFSRFAEPLSDNSAAWGGIGTTEKLGVTSSKIDRFSLTSGDFRTLGSDKDNSGKNIDSQDFASHGRPGSSPGLASRKEGNGDSAGDVSVNVNAKIGAADSWRKENSVYGEDGAKSNAERWHADPQPHPNTNIPPQHYDAWHGPPVNNHPGGVWYRGPPGGPPFVSPIAPGGFPMEPFPYYRPQIPPPALANPQPVPPAGAGPIGPHPKNGDMYRPHMHDAYIHHGIPLRPGFYPGPVPCDGYYGHPMGYCNSNERGASFMEMAMGPTAYNGYPGQNVHDPGNSHGKTSAYGSSSKGMVSEQMEGVHPQGSRGPYKVLLKQHDNWEGNDEEQKWDDSMKTNVPDSLKGEHRRKSSSESGRRADNKKDDEMGARRVVVGNGASSEAIDNQVIPMKVKSPEHVRNVNANDDCLGENFEHTASTVTEVATGPKNSSLIQKIECLNAKAWASDGRQDFKSVSSGGEQNNKAQVRNALASHSIKEVRFDSLSHEKTLVSGIINSAPHEERFSAVDKNLESAVVSGTTISRRSTHGMQGRADHRSKRRYNTHEADGWRKKSQIVDQQNVALSVQNEISTVSHSQHHFSAEAGLYSVSQPSGKGDIDSIPPVSDPNDSQCAKMRELAKRLKQREKEEEERTRERRAKALAKLEELNRRTQAGEVVTEKLENVPNSAVQKRNDESLNLGQPIVEASKSGALTSSLGSKTNTNAQTRHEESTTAAPPTVVNGKSRAPSSALDSSPGMIAQSIESSVDRVEKSTSVASNKPLEKPKTARNESVAVHEQLKSFQQDGNNADAPNCCTSQVHENSISKQKHTGYRQKHNPSEKHSNGKLISASAIDASKAYTDIATDTTRSESVAVGFISNCESNLSIAYNRYPGQNVHDPGNSHGRTSGYGSSSKAMVSEQMEAVHPQDSRGPYKILLMQHDSLEGYDEEQNNTSQVGNAMARHSTNGVGFDSLSHEKTRVSGIINSAPHEEHFSAGDKNLESAVFSETTISRISTHGLHGRGEHRSKGLLNTPEADGRRKTSQIVDPQNVASNIQNEISSVSYSQHRISAEAGQNSGSQPSGNDDVGSMPLASDPSDSQRAKARELAKRLKQREKEEEQQTREQSAKALAILEELNRRALAGEGVTQKLENVPTSAVQNRKDESLNLGQPTVVASKSGSPTSSLGPKTNTNAQSRHEESIIAASQTVVTGKSRAPSSAQDTSPSIFAQSSESSGDRVEKSASVASNIPLETPKTARNESVVHEQLKSFQQDDYNADAPYRCITSQVHDSSICKKRIGYRQKHNASENNSDEKFSASATDASKAYTDTATDAAPSESVAVEFISNCESNLSANLSATAESSAHYGKKNKSGKNKHKVEASCATSSPSKLSKETTSLDTSVESVKPKTSETMLDLSSDQSRIKLKDANRSSELQSSFTNEETHIRVNKQWKSHHARRMVRSQQFNKSAEKNQSGYSVVWAPVRSHNKTEVSDEANQNTVVDSVVLSLKSDQQSLNNPRNKRAKIERYIRKPVAKELSQQAVIPLTNQITSDDNVERPGSWGAESSTSGRATGKVGPTMESRNRDGRQNKSRKVHGSWCQRDVAESPTNTRCFPKSTEDHQHQKPVISFMKEQPRDPDEWNAVDGWGMPDNPDTAVNLPVLKDQGVVARGKRQPHKGHRAKGYNHNPDEKRTGDGDAEKVYVQSAAPEMHKIDSSVASKENHAVGEQSTSHGQQPKSQSISATNQRGTRAYSSGNVGPEGGRVSEKESSKGRGLLPQPDKDMFRPHSHHGHLPERSNLQEGPAVGHQELKRERKIGQRGRHGNPIESSSHSNMDVRQEQCMSSGFHKSGNPNNCLVREQESRGDWNGPGKDNQQQHNVQAIRERQRHNSHRKYQPVGPHNSNKTNNFESPKDGSHNSSGRHRERGQTRHGGVSFCGRQTVEVDVERFNLVTVWFGVEPP